MKEIKIGIQDNGYPCWLKGEVTLAEIEKIIKLLNEIKKNLLDSIFKKIGGNQEEDYED